MIDHVSVPVADLAAAARFYDRVLEPLGMRRLVERERTVGYGSRYPEFWLNLRDGHVGKPDSGHHVCLRARDDGCRARVLCRGARRRRQERRRTRAAHRRRGHLFRRLRS